MIQLLILGLLLKYPNTHGYELMKIMDQRHYKYIVQYTKGSLYYNLQKMNEKGFLSGTLDSNDPEITYFSVTPKGEQLFSELMDKYGNISEYVNLSFYTPMLFNELIPEEHYHSYINSQISQIESKIVNLDHALEYVNTLDPKFRLMLENSREHHKVNLKWFKSLLN